MLKAEATRLWLKKFSIDTCYYTKCQLPTFYKWLHILTGLWSNCATMKVQRLPLKIAHSGSLDRTIHPHAKTPGKIPTIFSLKISVFNVQYAPAGKTERKCHWQICTTFQMWQKISKLKDRIPLLFKPFQAESHTSVHWEEPDSLQSFTLGISLQRRILP